MSGHPASLALFVHGVPQGLGQRTAGPRDNPTIEREAAVNTVAAVPNEPVPACPWCGAELYACNTTWRGLCAKSSVAS